MSKVMEYTYNPFFFFDSNVFFLEDIFESQIALRMGFLMVAKSKKYKWLILDNKILKG
jgi:hypothetical protein